MTVERSQELRRAVAGWMAAEAGSTAAGSGRAVGSGAVKAEAALGHVFRVLGREAVPAAFVERVMAAAFPQTVHDPFAHRPLRRIAFALLLLGGILLLGALAVVGFAGRLDPASSLARARSLVLAALARLPDLLDLWRSATELIWLGGHYLSQPRVVFALVLWSLVAFGLLRLFVELTGRHLPSRDLAT